jgi:hypothetical protein
MHDHFPYCAVEIEEGLRDKWLVNEPPHYGIPVMPQWGEGEATHYMMYEDTTEGTPISPAFATPEELARWLTDNGASAFAGRPASYEAWLRVCLGGFAPSCVISCCGVESGVEALKNAK